jgi:hypothetical protein
MRHDDAKPKPPSPPSRHAVSRSRNIHRITKPCRQSDDCEEQYERHPGTPRKREEARIQ